MSESHGGRSRTSRAPIDYTSCFIRIRRLETKIARRSQVIRLCQPVDHGRRSRSSHRSRRRLLKMLTRIRSLLNAQVSPFSIEPTPVPEREEILASIPRIPRGGPTAEAAHPHVLMAQENAGEQRQPASRSKQAGADDAQPAPQPTQTSRKKKGT